MTNPGTAEVEKLQKSRRRLINDNPTTAEIGKMTTSGRDWKITTLSRGWINDHLGQRLKNYDPPRQRLEK
jgi:hypothetical protein